MPHELGKLLNGLASADRAMTRQELLTKMQRATEGRLTFGRGGRFDVDLMGVTQCVLEIRMTARRGEQGDTRHIRLYFTEPAAHEGVLLTLLLAWKSPGDMGHEEQNQHARLAQRRADDHHDWVNQ